MEADGFSSERVSIAVVAFVWFLRLWRRESRARSVRVWFLECRWMLVRKVGMRFEVRGSRADASVVIAEKTGNGN